MSPLTTTPSRPLAPKTTSPAGIGEHDSFVQKLESLRLLSSGVAHDFNNMLMTIQGNADLALTTTDEQPLELKNYLEEIQDASKRAAEYCHRLLAFSGRGPLPTSQIEVGPLIQQMACSLGQTVGDGVRLSYDLPDELPSIRGNPDELRAMLELLVRNARDAMPEGASQGEIRLSLASVEFDDPALEDGVGAPAKSSGLYVQIEVSDDGEGMDNSTRLRMLDPFFTTRGAGRGLGLASVFGTVQAHLGRIAVESEPGVGTRVRVFIPAIESTDPMSDLSYES